jgi:predicted nicotinamide N-methyase
MQLGIKPISTNGGAMERQSAAFWEERLGNWEEGMLQLQASYRLKQVEIVSQDYTISLAKVVNIDDLLELANDPDEIPFWAELWPSSIGLARYILENRTRFKGKSLLELGAGLGLAGIAAKLAGGRVIQSDFTAQALRFIEVNCLRNQVPVGRLLLADWRNFPVEIGGFDWIIGADILYEKNLHGDLLKIFEQSLKPGGAVLLADPGRKHAQDFMLQLMTEWRTSQVSYPLIYEGITHNIDIYQLEPGGTG